MESYGALAAHYDRLMAHVDYDAWADFALSKLRPTFDRDRTVLDLACGTGSISVRLARSGLGVVGIDRSTDMLAAAEAKAREWGVEVDFSAQDLTSFSIAGKADGAVCLFDSLNYLTTYEALENAFRRTADALRAGAPFLFDLHAEERLRRFAEETFGDVDDDVAYIWQSQYDERSRLCEMQVTLFVLDPQVGLFQRYEEVHYERAHSHDEVSRALATAGFELQATLGAEDIPGEVFGEGRLFYLARRQ